MGKYILIVLILLNMGCHNKNNNEENYFLDNFIDTKYYHGKNKEIKNENDKYFLTSIKEVNESQFIEDNKFFFGSKKKLSNQYYLFTYLNIFKSTKYIHRDNHKDLTFIEYTCIYDSINNKISSKLKTTLNSDAEEIYTTKKNNVYYIKGILYSRDQNGKIFEDSINHEFIINNFKFVKIK